MINMLWCRHTGLQRFAGSDLCQSSLFSLVDADGISGGFGLLCDIPELCIPAAFLGLHPVFVMLHSLCAKSLLSQILLQ